MQKIGVYSGTFDPVHDGHVQFALDSIKESGLDKVYFMVERNPRRKQGVRAYEHRQAMVQLAISEHDNLGSIVSDQDRFTPQDTLPLLQGRFKGSKLVMLMGEDMLEHMHEWPHVTELINSVDFVIGVRDDNKDIADKVSLIERTRSCNFNYQVFKTSLSNVSSSKVRSEYKNGKKNIPINPKVLEYIKNEGLYISSGDSAKN